MIKPKDDGIQFFYCVIVYFVNFMIFCKVSITKIKDKIHKEPSTIITEFQSHYIKMDSICRLYENFDNFKTYFFRYYAYTLFRIG